MRKRFVLMLALLLIGYSQEDKNAAAYNSGSTSAPAVATPSVKPVGAQAVAQWRIDRLFCRGRSSQSGVGADRQLPGHC